MGARRSTRWVADGAATGAQLLVFPEYGALEIAARARARGYRRSPATLAAAADRVSRRRVAPGRARRTPSRTHPGAERPGASRATASSTRAGLYRAGRRYRRAGQVDHDPVRARLGRGAGQGAARVRHRPRPHRHRHLLRQRVPAAGARAGGSRRGHRADPVLHRASVGLPSRAYGRAWRARSKTRSQP